jgi:fatty-acid peroxygenase
MTSMETTTTSISPFKAFRDFLSSGYNFIQNTCQKYDTDIFSVDAFGNHVYMMYGEEAARIFYDVRKFQRAGAAPKRIQKTLIGESGVQTLDGSMHHKRKEMFMSLMTPESIATLMKLIANQWLIYSRRWEKMEEVVLHEQCREIFCRAACAWVGINLQEDDVTKTSDDMYALVDAFGAAGPRHWRGRSARKRLEAWVAKEIDTYRLGPDGLRTPFTIIASFVDENGKQLDSSVAAVEVINLIRPIVAITTYVVFAALAMQQFPENVSKLKLSDPEFLDCFVNEVRRFYPFAPLTGARAKTDVEWNGTLIPKDALVFLDLYGTNHDPRYWIDPFTFRPERFYAWNKSAFNFIPQGGGDPHSGHRCAGEAITIEAMKLSVIHLCQQMSYEVPAQDLTVDLTRIPTFPHSGFIIRNVKCAQELTPVSSIETAQALTDLSGNKP